MGANRDHVACRLDRFLLGVALDALPAASRSRARDVSATPSGMRKVRPGAARQAAVRFPGRDDRCSYTSSAHPRAGHVHPRLAEPHVALALLLRVVERVSCAGSSRRTAERRSRGRTRSARAGRRCDARPRRSACRCSRAAVGDLRRHESRAASSTSSLRHRPVVGASAHAQRTCGRAGPPNEILARVSPRHRGHGTRGRHSPASLTQ